MKRSAHDDSYKDPVCGMEVSPLSAVDLLDYKGKTYYFCAGVCRDAFESDPEKYIHHHRQHGMKPN